MMLHKPPRLLEQFLLLVLNPRDRDTISGDLMEEYREDRLPRLGPLRADAWYFRQVFSVASYRLFNGPWLGRSVTALSLFTCAAGSWLLVMETVLKHQGQLQRSVVAVGIACQSLATLLWLIKDAKILRRVVFLGSFAFLWIAASALWRVTTGPHFEGFAVIIAAALLLQSAVTLAELSRKNHRGTV